MRYGLYHELLDFAPETVALHARGACVYDVSDARHGERGFSHVGGQHNAAAAVTVKNAVLLGLAQTRKQRQYFCVAGQRLMREVLAQVIGRFPNLALAG